MYLKIMMWKLRFLAEATNKTKVFNPGLCAMATLIGSYEELPFIHTKLRLD